MISKTYNTKDIYNLTNKKMNKRGIKMIYDIIASIILTIIIIVSLFLMSRCYK